MQLSKDFKARCSGIGQIMTNPKSKTEFLSKTCLSFVHKWIKEQPEFYGRHKNFKSKYTDKGNFCEDGSIDFASRYYKWGMVTKNDEYRENEYLTGTPDLVLANSIEDIKNSWHQDTFPFSAA